MKLNNGYEHISVQLQNFTGNDLARQVVMFANVSEYHTGITEYSEDDEYCKFIVDEVINGKTFPKYLYEGHRITFQINNISRICLAQITREQAMFCSSSSGVAPLTQDLIIPTNIYCNDKWLNKIKQIQKDIEELYIELLENDIPFMDARYIGMHAQTISLCYSQPAILFTRSCNSRTENNFADEINYVYRLMYHELKHAIDTTVTDKLSKKLWYYLLSFCDKKSFHCRDNNYNNDFERYQTPKMYAFEEPAHNDWRKSAWKLELEKMYKLQPHLLFDGEKEMIEKWINLEKEGKELYSTYDPYFEKSTRKSIKNVDYYEKTKI